MILFTQRVSTHLKLAIEAADTQIAIGDYDYQQLFSAGVGDIYLIIRGPAAREIVKVDIAASLWGTYLTISRGEGGSTPLAWPQGSKLFSATHADFYNQVMQPGDHRTVSDNPNELATVPRFAGEKIYQDGPAGCERWWKSYDGALPYWDLITGLPCGTEVYQAVSGFDYPLLALPIVAPSWQSFFDNTKWLDDGFGSWVTDHWESGDDAGDQVLELINDGSWYVGFRPTHVRITFTGQASIEFELYNDVDFQVASQTITSLQELAVTFSVSGDFFYIYALSTVGAFSITNMEWFA